MIAINIFTQKKYFYVFQFEIFDFCLIKANPQFKSQSLPFHNIYQSVRKEMSTIDRNEKKIIGSDCLKDHFFIDIILFVSIRTNKTS